MLHQYINRSIRLIRRFPIPRSQTSVLRSQTRGISDDQLPEVLGEALGPTSDHTPIYKFPYISIMQSVARLKYYPLIGTAVGVPLTEILRQLGTVTFDEVLLVSYIGATLTVPFLLIGLYAKGLIGIVYINKSRDKIIISHLDLWSRRKNITIPVVDVIPFSELATSRLDSFFVKVQCLSRPEYYKMNLTYGKKLDEKLFLYVFGKHEYL